MPLASSSTKAASSSAEATSSSTRRTIIPEDIIDWRAVASQLGSFVKIKPHESVVKQSGCVIINSRHSIPVQSFSGAETRATLFYIPGTGSVANCTDAIDAYASQMSAILSCRVVVIHPRFVPENKHPVPYNDVISVIKYLIEHGHENFVDEKGVRYDFKSRALVISGYSSGGLLATQIYLNSFQEGVSPFCQLLAIAPIVDISTLSNLSYGEKQQHFQEIFERFPSLYLPEGQPLASGHHSPRHMNLSELQLSSGRMTFIVGEKDPLKPQITDFVQWLQSLGCRAENRVIDDADHGLTWLQLSHLEDVKASFQSMLPEGPGPEHFELARLTRWLTLNEINESIISSLQAQLPHKLSGERFDLASDFMKLSFKTLEQEQDMKNKDKHEGGKSLTDEQLFNDEHRYLLAGESGSGKTTWLYHYVIQQLSASRFRSCILIRCRDFAMFNRRDADRGLDIQQLLQGLFFGRLTDSKGAFHEASRLEEYRKYILSHPELVLLAIDGADELPATLAAEHQLHQLLAYFPNVIMTGRHHALAAYARDKHYLQLQLQALTGEQQRSRLSRELPGTGSQPVFPLHSPLLLDLYCFSQQENAGRSISNQYQLLQQAVQQMIARYQSQRMGAASSSIHSSMSWQRSKPWQLALAMAARQGLQLMFSLDEVDTIVGELSHNNNRFFSIRDADYFWSDSGIANCGLFKTSQTGLEFIHPSFQAFFLAHHWLDLLENDPDQVMVLLIKHKYDDNYHHFWGILTGVLSKYPEQLCQFHSMWKQIKYNTYSNEKKFEEYTVNCYFYESLCKAELPLAVEQAKNDLIQENVRRIFENERIGQPLADSYNLLDSVYTEAKKTLGYARTGKWLKYFSYNSIATPPSFQNDVHHMLKAWGKEKKQGVLIENTLKTIKMMINLMEYGMTVDWDEAFAENYIQFMLDSVSQQLSVTQQLNHYKFNLKQIDRCIEVIESETGTGNLDHAGWLLHVGNMSFASEQQVLRLIAVATSFSHSDRCQQMALISLARMPQAFMLTHGEKLLPCLSDDNLTTCYYAANCLSRINHPSIRSEVVNHFPRLFFSDEKDRHLVYSENSHVDVGLILEHKVMTAEFANQLAYHLQHDNGLLRFRLYKELKRLSENIELPDDIMEILWTRLEDFSKQLVVMEAFLCDSKQTGLLHIFPKNVRRAFFPDYCKEYHPTSNLVLNILQTLFAQKLKIMPNGRCEQVFTLFESTAYPFFDLNLLAGLIKIEDKDFLKQFIGYLKSHPEFVHTCLRYSPICDLVDLVDAGFKSGFGEDIMGGLIDIMFEGYQRSNLDRRLINTLQLRSLFIKYQQEKWVAQLDQIFFENLVSGRWLLYYDYSVLAKILRALPSTMLAAIKQTRVESYNTLPWKKVADASDILRQFQFLSFFMPFKAALELFRDNFNECDCSALKKAVIRLFWYPYKVTFFQNKIYFQHLVTKQHAEFVFEPGANDFFSALKDRRDDYYKRTVLPVSHQNRISTLNITTR